MQAHLEVYEVSSHLVNLPLLCMIALQKCGVSFLTQFFKCLCAPSHNCLHLILSGCPLQMPQLQLLAQFEFTSIGQLVSFCRLGLQLRKRTLSSLHGFLGIARSLDGSGLIGRPVCKFGISNGLVVLAT